MNELELTPDQQSQLIAAEAEAEAANRLLKEYQELLERMRKQYPPNRFGLTQRQIQRANEVDKVLERIRQKSDLPYRLRSKFRFQHEAALLNQKKEQEETLKREREAQRDHLTTEAILWIQAECPDKKLGTDFEVRTAIDYANSIAFWREVNRLRATQEFHPFSGQNCGNCLDDDELECRGWDGESHRCECGNRRVNWVEGDGHSFKDPQVVAEAY